MPTSASFAMSTGEFMRRVSLPGVTSAIDGSDTDRTCSESQTNPSSGSTRRDFKARRRLPRSRFAGRYPQAVDRCEQRSSKLTILVGSDRDLAEEISPTTPVENMCRSERSRDRSRRKKVSVDRRDDRHDVQRDNKVVLRMQTSACQRTTLARVLSTICR